MKNQYVIKSATVLGLAFFLILNGAVICVNAQSNEEIKSVSQLKPYNVENPIKDGPETVLVEAVKSSAKTKEKSLILETEFRAGNGANVFWKLKGKEISLKITKHETVEQASREFKDVESGRFISLNILPSQIKDLGDEAILRLKNTNDGSRANVYFRKGKYTVSVEAQQKDARRFADYVMAAIDAQ